MVNKRFKALDAFRGLCALSIVVFHMQWLNSITELEFFKGSWIFVEFFFVLSGFVLAHGYGFKDKLNFKIFMKARFFRLYPLHFSMFIFAFAFQVFKLIADKYSGLSFGVAPFTEGFALSEIIPNLLLIQSWSPYTEHISYNGASWSISIEFYMYALLFISIVAFKSYKIISWVLISIIFFILIYSGSDLLVDPILRGLSCFFGGAAIYALYKGISNFKPSYLLGSIVELLLILSIVFIVQSHMEHKPIVASILFFLTVLFFAFESGIVSKLLKMKPFQEMGKLSYSIYMTHSILFMYIAALFKVIDSFVSMEMRVFVGDAEYMDLGGAEINNLAIMIILALVIYTSSLTYKYIELNGQKLNKRKIISPEQQGGFKLNAYKV